MNKRLVILIGYFLTASLLPATARTHLEIRLEIPCAPGMTSFSLPRDAGSPQVVCLSTDLVLDDSNIVRAVGGTDNRNGRRFISLTLDKAGQARLAAATRQNLGRRMAILFDGMVLSAPLIFEPILGDSVQLSGVDGEVEEILRVLGNGPSPT